MSILVFHDLRDIRYWRKVSDHLIKNAWGRLWEHMISWNNSISKIFDKAYNLTAASFVSFALTQPTPTMFPLIMS